MNHRFITAALGIALGFAATAQADVSAVAGMKSNGFFHGVTVTDDKPMMFGQVHYALPNGLYAFGKANNVAGGGEVDLGGGLKRQLGIIGIDAGVISYNFTDPNRERIDEVYLGASYGPMSAALASNKGGQYLQVNAGQALQRDLKLGLHWGNTLPKSGAAFWDAGVELTKDFRRFQLSGEVVHSTAAQVGGTKFSVGVSRPLDF